MKLSDVTEDALAAEFRAALQAAGGLASFECEVVDLRRDDEPPSAVLVAAAKAEGQPAPARASTYTIVCDGGPFAIRVEGRTAWATVTPSGDKAVLGAYHTETDRIWEAGLKGKVFAIARGAKLRVSGVRSIARTGLSLSGFSEELRGSYGSRPLLWVLSFVPQCRHEGLGCTFEDGIAANIALAGSSCTAELAEQKGAWLASIDAGKAGTSKQPMLAMLDVVTAGDAEVRKRLADTLRSEKRFEELVALLVADKNADALQSLAAERQQAHQPAVAIAAYGGLRTLKGDDPAVLAKLGAAYLEANDSKKALDVLRLAAAGKTDDAAHQKEVGQLLDVAGDKEASKAALGRACALGDKEACAAAK